MHAAHLQPRTGPFAFIAYFEFRFNIHAFPIVIIFWLLALFGLALVVVALGALIHGICCRRSLQIILAILVPVLYWGALFWLIEADRRFVEEEIRKNGGELPDWVW